MLSRLKILGALAMSGLIASNAHAELAPFALARMLFAQTTTRTRTYVPLDTIIANNAAFSARLPHAVYNELNHQGWHFVGTRGKDSLLVKGQAKRVSDIPSARLRNYNEDVLFPSQNGAIIFQVGRETPLTEALQIVGGKGPHDLVAESFIQIATREIAEAGLSDAGQLRLLYRGSHTTSSGTSAIHFQDIALNSDGLDAAVVERILSHFAP